MQRNPICQRYRGGVIVNDGTAQFSVKTVCAKEYVDAVNTAVNELKEKYIFQFDLIPKERIQRSGKSSISVNIPVPEGYERLMVTVCCTGFPVSFVPDLGAEGARTNETMDLWMQSPWSVDEAQGTRVYNAIGQLAISTIFVKKE